MKKIYLCLWLLASSAMLYAQEAFQYQMPPQAMADLADAPSTPQVSFDNRRDMMLLLEFSEKPSIAELAQPELRIGGLRINPQSNGLSRGRAYQNFKLRKIKGQDEINIKGLPQNLLASEVSWSPDDRKIAFVHSTGQARHLYIIDVATATATKLSELALNGVFGTSMEWLPNSQGLLVYAVAANRGAAPQANPVPQGPTVQENLGKQAPVRTYQDLLKNTYDEALFDYYGGGELWQVALNGQAKKLTELAVLSGFGISPDGKYILAERMQKPYSYLVPYYGFPRRVEILDNEGKLVKLMAALPSQESVPAGFNAVPTGQRNHNWRPDQPATLYWVEAQDEGNPKKEAVIRDKVFTLAAPFAAPAQELAALPLRYSRILWSGNQLALVYQSWWASRKELVWRLQPNKPQAAPVVLFERSTEDRYNAPGNPVMQRNQAGRSEIYTDGKKIFFFGQGASAEGDRPFVDEMDLNSKKTTRLWRSEAPYYESPVAFLDYKSLSLVTLRESVSENPNYWIRELRKRIAPMPLTSFPNPYPMMADVKKETIKYKRKDGVDMQFEMYLPANYKKEQGKLPAFLWAYPREFKSQATASQVSGSPYQFVRIGWGSPIYWVTQGYAILDNASMPIVGAEGKEPNDNFIEQLVMNAEAAIAAAEATGVVDTKRVAVGGHSYGAFMTAHLLAHTDLFAAGIARSGAYNRTLTPFGFQSEERTYWEAQQIYTDMSPFSYANKIKEPLLLIHGEADNNSGTFPIQSERFYNALKGHGATTRLVFLPYESHGYAAKESIMHMLWEMNQWMDKYVKNK